MVTTAEPPTFSVQLPRWPLQPSGAQSPAPDPVAFVVRCDAPPIAEPPGHVGNVAVRATPSKRAQAQRSSPLHQSSQEPPVSVPPEHALVRFGDSSNVSQAASAVSLVMGPLLHLVNPGGGEGTRGSLPPSTEPPPASALPTDPSPLPVPPPPSASGPSPPLLVEDVDPPLDELPVVGPVAWSSEPQATSAAIAEADRRKRVRRGSMLALNAPGARSRSRKTHRMGERRMPYPGRRTSPHVGNRGPPQGECYRPAQENGKVHVLFENSRTSPYCVHVSCMGGNSN